MGDKRANIIRRMVWSEYYVALAEVRVDALMVETDSSDAHLYYVSGVVNQRQPSPSITSSLVTLPCHTARLPPSAFHFLEGAATLKVY
jgi:hypothetical protein